MTLKGWGGLNQKTGCLSILQKSLKMLRHPVCPKGVLLIVLLDLFKVSKMSHFYYGMFKIGIMTYFNYDLFKVSKMCVLFFFVYNEIQDATQQ